MMLEAEDDGIEDVSSDEEPQARAAGPGAAMQRRTAEAVRQSVAAQRQGAAAVQRQAYQGGGYRQPAAITASRGLAGIFDEQGGQIMDVSNLPPNAVLLNVYDVSDTEVIQRINRFTTANNAVLVGGVFHGGVEVYGREWSYGCTEDSRTGVGAVPPRCHPQHTYRSTVHIGNTGLSREQVGSLLSRLAAAWPGNEYNLIHKNCLSFCNELLQELGLRRVPGWVDRAPRAASQVDRAVTLLRGLSADDVQSHLQSQVAEVQDVVQGQLAEVAEVVEATRAEIVEKVLPELTQADIGAKAAELGEMAQEQVQAISNSFWQWTQEVANQLADDSPAPVLDDIKQKAEEHFEGLRTGLQHLGEELHRTLEGPGPGHDPRRRGAGPRKAGKRSLKPVAAAAAADDLDEEGSGDDARAPKLATGLIRKQEELIMSKGLLDGSDDEDEEQDAVQMARAAMGDKAPPPVMDLLSGDIAPAPATKPAAAKRAPAAAKPAAPSLDLLGDHFDPNKPLAAPAEEPLPRVGVPAAEAAPASCDAATNLMDFVADKPASADAAPASKDVDPLDLLTGVDLLA